MEIKVAEKFAADLGVPVDAQCQGVAFGLADTGVRLWHKTEFKLTADAKGFKRGKLIPVMASFCPFCGKSAKPDDADAANGSDK
jgi:hypothetical protein